MDPEALQHGGMNMLWILVTLLVLVSLLLAGAVFVAYRFYRRAVIYDEVFQFIYGDIELNLRQFQKLKTSAVTSNDSWNVVFSVSK